MAKRRKTATDDRDWSENFADNGMDETALGDELMDSMRSYIDYTLTDRALPYIDGLKPVHRATLWCMWKDGIKSTSSYVKSLAVSGEVVARMHPHSSDAAYLAAAGITRSKADDSHCGACKLNLSLIDGHGNFGASFEDSPAAPRYSEMRLSKSGEACVRDVTDGAVFMEPTFDAKDVIPEVMPIRIPLLLINGSDGLAYGYNVSWLPHNPSEAIEACILRIDNPSCSTSDVMKVMPGPDFPSGGIVVDRSEQGLDDAYDTGFGSMLLSSRYEVRQMSRGRHVIDIYETPYGVARSGGKGAGKTAPSIVVGITNFAQMNPEYGITDVKNLSDNDHDCLIEVSVKSGIDAETVARALVEPGAHTRLTETMSYRQSVVLGKFSPSAVPDATGEENVLRLTSPRPTDVGMLGYIDAFIDFRVACVTNESVYKRNKALDHKHLIDGMLLALIDIDKVIDIVRHSMNKDTAAKNLRHEFKLDAVQADYILAIPLARLTKSDKIKLESNSKDLAAQAKQLDKILSSKKNIIAEVRRQLVEEKDRQVLPRRTTIISASGKVIAKAKGDSGERLDMTKVVANAVLGNGSTSMVSSDDDEIPAHGSGLHVSGSTNIYMSADGSVVRCDDTPKRPFISSMVGIDINDMLMLVFDDGDSQRLHAYEISSKPVAAKHKCVGVIEIGDGSKIPNICLTTSDGRVKVLDSSTLTKSLECPVMSLSDGAKVMSASADAEDARFVLITDDAHLLTFGTSSVNPQGRTSAGVAGMRIASGANLLFASIATQDASVLTSTDMSSKTTPLAEYPTKGRGTSGVRCQTLLKKETKLSIAAVATGMHPIDASGKDVIVSEGKRDASGQTKKQAFGYRVD